ncbi:Multisite-specific tRNA:(cytosine-C(5))-methyltransferase [Venturia nashicola]|uniref:Multisite-specific tRNA:(Cytosine-C(5))-methyltransferase n=1 Tax=Venturia nashicola TaxID=86259 RepID=A0A4Z1NNI6_9PEZI|nr:Multisite-specific tRNA:(cytosine-C(5))-methyltransferase [Venturia nashicola]
MPPSQLKRLKASLRENGIVGPQKSKKEKKKAGRADQRSERNIALNSIRDAFNPFETKQASRPSKKDVTTPYSMKLAAQGKTGGTQVFGRPGVSKSNGEALRRRTLLGEVEGRHKVGGIVDRRIGENDPGMAPEEKALQRFTREQERKAGGGRRSMFDLEGEEEVEELALTHLGQSLSLGKDDFDGESVDGGSEDEDARPNNTYGKRKLGDENEDGQGDDEGPEKKKSRAEVMKEVMLKSKAYKYERQQAKEDDEEVREKLDKGIGDLRSTLLSLQTKLEAAPKPLAAPVVSVGPGHIDPGRAALMETGLNPDKDYDLQIKRMAMDTRAKPTDRTRTDEEKAKYQATRQKELDEGRIRRMAGLQEDDGEDSGDQEHEGEDPDAEPEYVEGNDAVAFGLATETKTEKTEKTLYRPDGVEDEDEFVIDKDLVASDSEGEEVLSEDESESEASEDEMVAEQDGDNEFLYGKVPATGANSAKPAMREMTSSCPTTYSDIVDLLEKSPSADVNAIIRRIRQRYDSGLSSSNKDKLVAFAQALVEYLRLRPTATNPPSLKVFETIIRHLHSMSKAYPDPIAQSIRSHLEQMHTELSMNAGDLMILTTICTIYPTSDHFHQVVTPAITLIGRWLGLTAPDNAKALSTGAYLGALCIKFQSFSKRYIPELIRFTLNALRSGQPIALLEAHITNLLAMADFWSAKSAFIETFTPFLTVLKSLHRQKEQRTLQILLQHASLSRRPLELHHHKPQPIKSAVPKFEESFNPDRHYDPDKERAEANKLQKDYKREKKGAMRELRKDGNFLAREKLREKKERDEAYEKKYKRLVAEIQGEEGHEKKVYERERNARKSTR